MALNYKAMGEMIMTSKEQAMYGMSTEDIKEQYMDSITAKCSGLEMVVAGILSDAQELLAYTNTASYQSSEEVVRKQLNVAKFVLFEMMDQKERV